MMMIITMMIIMIAQKNYINRLSARVTVR